MDTKQRKLFVVKQSKKCRVMSKMHQNTFGGWALPGPAGEAYALPGLPGCNGGVLLMGGRGREGAN